MPFRYKQYRVFKLFELNRLLNVFLDNQDYYNKPSYWERYIGIVKDIAVTDRIDRGLDVNYLKDRFAELKNMFDLSDHVITEFVRLFYEELYDELVNLSFDDAIKTIQKNIATLEIAPRR